MPGRARKNSRSTTGGNSSDVAAGTGSRPVRWRARALGRFSADGEAPVSKLAQPPAANARRLSSVPFLSATVAAAK